MYICIGRGLGVGDGGGGVDLMEWTESRFGSVSGHGSREVVKKGWVGWAVLFCLSGWVGDGWEGVW